MNQVVVRRYTNCSHVKTSSTAIVQRRKATRTKMYPSLIQRPRWCQTVVTWNGHQPAHYRFRRWALAEGTSDTHTQVFFSLWDRKLVVLSQRATISAASFLITELVAILILYVALLRQSSSAYLPATRSSRSQSTLCLVIKTTVFLFPKSINYFSTWQLPFRYFRAWIITGLIRNRKLK